MSASIRRLASSMLLAAGFLSLLACGGGGGGGSSSSPAPTPSVTVAVSPTSTTVTAATTAQFTATVANTTTTTVTWSVQEGASGGTVSASGLYTAPSTPGTYHVIATSTANSNVSASATVTVVAAPVITGITASPTAVVSGGSSTLTATFTGGTGSFDHSLGAVTSGTGVSTGALTAATTYTLTVTNAAGTRVTGTVTVGLITGPPTITSFTASANPITLGTSTVLSWVIGTPATSLTLDQGIGDVTQVGTQSVKVTPTAATTYTLTATNPLGSATASVTVNVVFPPTITSFSASPTTVTPGSASTLTAVFAQGTGVIMPGNLAVTTGTSLPTGALSTDTTYTLTVTNSAQTSVQKQLTVHVDPGTYTAAGNTMSATRQWHTCTLLPNGKALVAGGTTATAAADEFDPAANGGLGGFTPSANGMSTLRLAASAVLLPNGKVLILGGYNPNLSLPRQLTSADLYDPATRTFTPSAGHLGTARQQCTATLLLNGKVLIVGGFNDTQHTLGSAEIYDPVADTFTPSAATLGAPRSGQLATLLPDGKVLISGGSTNSTTQAGSEVYDPALDAFAPAGGSNLAAQWFTQTRLSSGKVLIALTGMNVPSISLIYDPATGQATATTGSPDPTRFQMPTATLMGDGRVLLAGNLGAPGFDKAGDSELYDPATQMYHYTANPGDRWAQVATLLPDGRVLLAGGFDTTTTQDLNTGTLFNAGPAVPAPAPTVTLTAPATAKAGTTGLTASVPATTGATYFWMVSNGTITGGLGTASLTFTAGTAGTPLQVDCLVVSPYGIPGHGTATVSVTP